MKLRAAIVGLGRIGAGYDLGADPAQRVQTHASAFAAHPSFELVGGCDPDPAMRERFAKHYPGALVVSSWAELSAQAGKLDVVALASPTAHHLEQAREILASPSRPRVLLAEKPLGRSLDEAREILSLARSAGSEVVVNFMRRFEPGSRKVAEKIQSGAWGALLNGVVWYSKGLRNNGSHWIDLLRFWLGEPSSFKILRDGKRPTQALADDPEPDFRLEWPGGGAVHFLACSERAFSAKEIELAFEGGMLHYLDGGARIEFRAAVESQAFAGYRELGPGQRIPGDFARSQYHVADAIARGTAPTGETALGTLEWVEKLTRSV